MTDHYLDDNLGNWNDRALVHADSEMYDVSKMVDDPGCVTDVVAFDAPLLGDIAGARLVHLQCHIGTDTISLARLGATVTGVDFAPAAIAAAQELSERSGTPARFVLSEVTQAADVLGERFDVVYTSIGAICWLPDLVPWAETVASLLEPGGRFYIRDGHPSFWPLEEVDGKLVPQYSRHTTPNQPLSWDEANTYTDGDHSRITNTKHHEWYHSFPSIVNALVGAGLVIDRLEEHDGIDWEAFPSCTKEGTQWFLPEPWRSSYPTMFSLWAHKPHTI